MSAELKLKALAGGSLTLQVDDTLATDETFNVSEGGIESGSNANGSYTKFPDGTLICTGEVAIPNTTLVLNANIGTYGWSYYYESNTFTFAVPFITAPIVTYGVNSSLNGTHENTNPTTVGGNIYGFSRVVTASGIVRYQAIGRWK